MIYPDTEEYQRDIDTLLFEMEQGGDTFENDSQCADTLHAYCLESSDSAPYCMDGHTDQAKANAAFLGKIDWTDIAVHLHKAFPALFVKESTQP